MAPDAHIQSIDFGTYERAIFGDVKVSLSNRIVSPLIRSAFIPSGQDDNDVNLHVPGTINFDPNI